MGTQTMIKVKELTKCYNKGSILEVKALDDVSFKIGKGEFTNIVGVSGSGKSTLLNIIGCMDRPTKGELEIDGIKIHNLQDWNLSQIRHEQIGFIFQDMFLLPNLSSIDNILLPKLPYGVSKADRKRASILMQGVGLVGRGHSKPTQLSGGQKQRVAICRALINNPSIILADEPTGNLDSKNGIEILRLLKEINEKMDTTIIIVTHDPKVDKFARRRIELFDGQIISDQSNGNK
ncbi:MAG: ABC transporter ATP-binding protein [Candidatus Kariarchaeaceae archaeon]|jgi:putative ABC transport system ATP-binding protein